MKNLVKLVLQKLLGYDEYLYRFANYKIKRLKDDPKENDFFVFMEEIDKQGYLLDVGANIGIMTYHLSLKFPDRTLIAIEPMPSNFEILERICEDYSLSNVDLIHGAVGNEKKMIDMVLPVSGKVKMQGLAHVVHDSINEWNEGEQIRVQCHTIDEIMQDRKVGGIKMDIENFEFFALEGAKRILKRDRPVLYLELWPNENRDKCFNLLCEELGYGAFVVEEKKCVAYDSTKHQSQNFIFK